MRTYLIDAESKEVIIDLKRTRVHHAKMVEYHFSTLEKNKTVNEEKIFLRKLAGSFFVSPDGVRWHKLAKQDLPARVINVDKVYKVYRGFKPSGLAGTAAGDLRTQMPGKIVKILCKVGEEVKKGQTLIIFGGHEDGK
jgi:biotin carboxyl carrier protein